MANENNQVQQNATNELVVRREKLAALVEAGKNPFEITKYETTHTSKNAIAEYVANEEALLAEGKATDDRAFSPSYLRMPQAERERLEKEKANG